ncbi:MAG: hypothetical protein IJK18_01295 [Clostridia bacterium]|nr:hypothetical protein [Clostridia bacterium]
MRKINTFNKKKIIITLLIVLIIILFILVISLYISQKSVRNWIDIYILRKNVSEHDIQTINLNTDKNNQIHVFNNYITLLNDKKITFYNSYGEMVTSIDININSALFDSSGKYLAIAENKGNEICLVLDKNYLWSEKIEGEILQIHVNRNGYVAAITTDATHKSIVTFFNSLGKKLFTSYFGSTRIVDASISNDNQYIAIGELDTTGTIIKSNVKILSAENAKNDSENTIIYTYEADEGNLITNVKYQSKNQIACIYDNGIGVIKDQANREIIKIDNNNVTYLANDFNNHISYVKEESTGFFKSQSDIYIVNTIDFQEKNYVVENSVKDVLANDNIIAVNVGTEIYFLDTSGWLIKKYSSNQEITNVKFSESLAAIIYRDRIVIVDL